ncbi:short-chain dehydrogenase [Diplodia corticola]|uniref:Short-chain dehydrogenase n=1 Tax=Diplodia corticola TaxID=236234 RepID=A0A1J9QND5_9PEZI|nr:short-chain dehydrogenase [Diplodia corticola]OJD29570.1 short-chain dehydrogenase [Diplodia corticola]
MSSQPLIWVITGATSGFGLALSLRALRTGHTVYSTVRRRTGDRYADAVKTIEEAGGKCVELDVSDLDAIPKAIESILGECDGKVDVLVNNAGLKETKHQMDTNFFGPLSLIQAVIPYMRARRTGTIVNISSTAGFYALPSCGLYSASKFALEGLTESLAAELTPFGIDVLLVEPGAFRTSFLKSGVRTEKALSPAYAEADHPLAKTYERFNQYKEQGPPGDPEKAARVMYEVIVGNTQGEQIGEAGELKGKVLRLLLGSDAVSRMEGKIGSLQSDLKTMRSVAMATDADDARKFVL